MTDVYEIEVPKTVGEDGISSLRIDIRTDEHVLGPGLFIYGFLPNSNAEQQGLLRVGDELLTVNDLDVEGGTIPDLVSAMQNEEYVDSSFVPMMVRRQMDQFRHVSNVATPFAPLPVVEENAFSPYSQKYNHFNEFEGEQGYNNEYQEQDIDSGAGSGGGGDLNPEGIVFEVDVPKTQNHLQLDIRNDPQVFEKGLFLFGYLMPDSLAEHSGNLMVGDEILEVNGINVAGGTSEDVDAILRDDVFPDVLLKVHRMMREPSVVSSEKRPFIKVIQAFVTLFYNIIPC